MGKEGEGGGGRVSTKVFDTPIIASLMSEESLLVFLPSASLLAKDQFSGPY